MADHNDPNAVNPIFSDIDLSAADVYDMFGFPSDDPSGGEKVVVALTFAPVPQTGAFDTALLHRICVTAHPRVARPSRSDWSLEAMFEYFEAVAEKYVGNLKPAEIRATVDQAGRGTINFKNFVGGTFTAVVGTNTVETIKVPGGPAIKAYLGGRDDAFFNDLTGFFRSINYAPQFYHVPHTMTEARELPNPKTPRELEGNDLFNVDQATPMWGRGVKKDLPPGPWTWKGDKFRKDANGNYRFVYSGQDAQAGRNVN